jgi:hypothetical protein
MKRPIDLIHDHLESALFVAHGMPITPHQLCLVNDIQRAVDLWRKLFNQAEERHQKVRAA